VVWTVADIRQARGRRIREPPYRRGAAGGAEAGEKRRGSERAAWCAAPELKAGGASERGTARDGGWRC
jgi:hypothetical protein